MKLTNGVIAKNYPKIFLGGYRFINYEVDEAWFNRYLQSRSNSVRCAIIDDNDQIVGCVYLLNIDNINLCADVHIMIGDKDNRGKGIGTFALHSIVNHAF